MSQCWRWIVVDGSFAPGQKSCGTIPIKFCKGPRRKLSASQPDVKSNAIVKPKWKCIKSSSKDKDISQTIPVICRDRITQTYSDSSGHE